MQPSLSDPSRTAEYRQVLLAQQGRFELGSLDDATTLALLGLLDAASLSAAGAASRHLYCCVHASTLWRDATLRAHGGAFAFRGSWRETCTGRPHVPLRSCGYAAGRGVFSDTLFSPWYYSGAGRGVDPAWLARSNVARRAMDGMSLGEFVEAYDRPGVPCIVTGCADRWRGASEWTRERLAQRFPSATFRVSAKVDMTLDDFFRYCDEGACYVAAEGAAAAPAAPTAAAAAAALAGAAAGSAGEDDAGGSGTPAAAAATTTTTTTATATTATTTAASAAFDERPLYLFDKDFLQKCPAMEAEFEPAPYFAEDLMGALGAARRPDYRWLIVGPALSGSSFHVDPNANFAWNATVQGRKKWILYPPATPPPLRAEDDRQVSLLQWFDEHYDADPHAGVRLECVTGPGECMYVPRGWWHCVLNLELCVAITHNVVTSQNLLAAVEHLEAGATCPPGEGCRGGSKVYLSGDVPASVIFPYKEAVEQAALDDDACMVRLEPEAGAAAGEGGSGDAAAAAAAGGEAGEWTCECHAQSQRLLRDWKRALERERPGLLERLQQQAEREREDAKKVKTNVTWTALKESEGGGAQGGGAAAPFSFGFG